MQDFMKGIRPGSIIEIVYGNPHKGWTGTVIGAHLSEFSGYPMLAVAMENGYLLTHVLPEQVMVTDAAPRESLAKASLYFTEDEFEAISKISRAQFLVGAWHTVGGVQ